MGAQIPRRGGSVKSHWDEWLREQTRDRRSDTRDTRDAAQLGAALLRSNELAQFTKDGQPRKRRVLLSTTHDAFERLTR